VTFWSVFTGLTAAAWNFGSLLVVRFLFGAGEAGAFPGIARAVYAWIPVNERGLVKGVNFSASRLGAALTMPLLPWMIATLGWKMSFVLLMGVGFVWAVAWWVWFRDDPAHHEGMPAEERELILRLRQDAATQGRPPPPLPTGRMLRSPALWLMMGQYFAGNFTFFFCLTWLFPYIQRTYGLSYGEAGWYAMVPLLAGAAGNLVAGTLVDRLYRTLPRWSRRLPAVVGFALAAVGLVMSVGQETVGTAVFWLSLAVFGADMTLSPSWSFCIDIGGPHAGKVSGTMNMAGNLGSAVVAIAFPYLLAWTGGPAAFFYLGAALNTVAIGLWLAADSSRRL
jgi:ACS family glucarate transporter-like MFS transporter